jgi:hypothetical protein
MLKLPWRNLIVIAGFMIPNFLSAQVKSSDPRLKDLAIYIDSALKEFKVAGCAVAIVEKNKVIFAGGFGYRTSIKTPGYRQYHFSDCFLHKSFYCGVMWHLV